MVGSGGSARRMLLAVSLSLAVSLAGCGSVVLETTPITADETQTDTPDEWHAYEQPSSELNVPSVPEDRNELDDEIDVGKIEQKVVEYLNDLRRGELYAWNEYRRPDVFRHDISRQTLREDPRLSKMAASKSTHMGRHEYLGHGRPSDETKDLSWRMSKWNYACSGGENLAYVGWGEDDNESAVAYELILELYHSLPHQQLMYTKDVSTVGVGIYVSDRERVYLTMLIC